MSAARILSTSARGPLGLTARQVAMCARAKKAQPIETRFVDREGYPIGAHQLSALAETIHGVDRLVRMAAPALRDAWVEGLRDVPLVLAVAEAGRADDDATLSHGLIDLIVERARVPIDRARSFTVRAGHAGFAIAVEHALAILASPGAPAAVMVGGVDSYVHPDVLAALDDTFRLHSPSNQNGFIPSEGAAFLCLSRESRDGRVAKGLIERVLCAHEMTVGTDAANTAQAMTMLLRAMRDDAPIHWVMPDVTGERHRVREWTMASLRVLEEDDDVVIHEERLTDDLGDVGAATGAMFAVIACEYFAARCAPSSSAVIALHSEDRERGVLRVSATREPR